MPLPALSSSKKESSVKRADDFSESPNSEKERIIDAYNYNMGISPKASDEEKQQAAASPHKSSLWIGILKGVFILSQVLLFALTAMLSYALVVGISFVGTTFPFFIGKSHVCVCMLL